MSFFNASLTTPTKRPNLQQRAPAQIGQSRIKKTDCFVAAPFVHWVRVYVNDSLRRTLAFFENFKCRRRLRSIGELLLPPLPPTPAPGRGDFAKIRTSTEGITWPEFVAVRVASLSLTGASIESRWWDRSRQRIPSDSIGRFGGK